MVQLGSTPDFGSGDIGSSPIEEAIWVRGVIGSTADSKSAR